MNLCGNFIGMKCSFKTSKLNGCESYYDSSIASFEISPQVSDLNIMVPSAASTTTAWGTILSVSSSCVATTQSYTYAYTSNGVTVSQPSWLTNNTNAKTFTVA